MELSKCAKIFKALSNEQRLRIFIMIYRQCCKTEGSETEPEFKIEEGACSSGEGSIEKAFTKICKCISLSRSTISHHLKELQNAGLISCERKGQTFRYRVNEEAVNSVKEFLS